MCPIKAFDLTCINAVLSEESLQYVIRDDISKAKDNFYNLINPCIDITNKIKSIRFTDCNFYPENIFENIVKFITTWEDSHDLEIDSIEINLNNKNKSVFRVFYDLADFYGNSIEINMIPNDYWNPLDLLVNGLFPVEKDTKKCIHGLSYGIGEQLSYVSSMFLTEKLISSMSYFINSFYMGNKILYNTFNHISKDICRSAKVYHFAD